MVVGPPYTPRTSGLSPRKRYWQTTVAVTPRCARGADECVRPYITDDNAVSATVDKCQ